MSDDAMTDPKDGSDAMPTNTQLEEPSTEKDPGEEPKATPAVKNDQPAPTHEATGIGVIDDGDD